MLDPTETIITGDAELKLAKEVGSSRLLIWGQIILLH